MVAYACRDHHAFSGKIEVVLDEQVLRAPLSRPRPAGLLGAAAAFALLGGGVEFAGDGGLGWQRIAGAGREHRVRTHLVECRLVRSAHALAECAGLGARVDVVRSLRRGSARRLASVSNSFDHLDSASAVMNVDIRRASASVRSKGRVKRTTTFSFSGNLYSCSLRFPPTTLPRLGLVSRIQDMRVDWLPRPIVTCPMPLSSHDFIRL